MDKIQQYLDQGGRLFLLFSAEGIGKDSGLQSILIGLGMGIVDYVVKDPEHSDRVGTHMIIDRLADHVQRILALEIDMRHLAERMHARIGAPGSTHVDKAAREFVKRLDQPALHRRPVRLHLPAEKGRAVIFKRETIAWHRSQVSVSVRRDKVCKPRCWSASAALRAAGRRGRRTGAPR